MQKLFQKFRFSLSYLLIKILNKNTIECWLKIQPDLSYLQIPEE